MNVAELVEIIKEKCVELNNSKHLDFKDFVKLDNWGPKPRLLEFIGVYVVFEGNTPIYVGSAGKGKHVLKFRIADLFSYSPKSKTNKFYHTLTSKLVQKQSRLKGLERALDDVRKFYLENCSFKVVRTDTIDQARMLEHVFILLLNHPKYNG